MPRLTFSEQQVTSWFRYRGSSRTCVGVLCMSSYIVSFPIRVLVHHYLIAHTVLHHSSSPGAHVVDPRSNRYWTRLLGEPKDVCTTSPIVPSFSLEGLQNYSWCLDILR
jgi:hypothetical protein